MTLDDLRTALACLSADPDLPVCRHDGEYGATDPDWPVIMWEIIGRRYRWTYATEEEAKEMCDEGESVAPLVLLK